MTHRHAFISCVNKYNNITHYENGQPPLVRLNPDLTTFLGDNGYYERNIQTPSTLINVNLPRRMVEAGRSVCLSQDFLDCASAFVTTEGIKELFDAKYTTSTALMRIRMLNSDHEYGINDYAHKYIPADSAQVSVGVVSQATATAHSLEFMTAKQALDLGTAVNTFQDSKIIPTFRPANVDGAVAQYGGFQADPAGGNYPAGQESTRTPVTYWREGFDLDGTHHVGESPNLVEYFYVDPKASCDPYDYGNNSATPPTRKLIQSNQQAWLTARVLASTATWKVVVCDKPLWSWPASPVAGYADYSYTPQPDGFQTNFTYQRDQICQSLSGVTGLIYIGGDDHTALVVKKSAVNTDPTYDADYPNGLVSITVPAWKSTSRPGGTIPPYSNAIMQDAGIMWGLKTHGFVTADFTSTTADIYFRTLEEGDIFAHFQIASGTNNPQLIDNQYLAATATSNVANSGDVSGVIQIGEGQEVIASLLNTSFDSLSLLTKDGLVARSIVKNIPSPSRSTTNYQATAALTETVAPYRTLNVTRNATATVQPEDFKMFLPEELGRTALLVAAPTTRTGGTSYVSNFGSINTLLNRTYINVTGDLAVNPAATVYDSFYGWQGWLVPYSEAASIVYDTSGTPTTANFAFVAGYDDQGIAKADGTSLAFRAYVSGLDNYVTRQTSTNLLNVRFISFYVRPNAINNGFIDIIDGNTAVVKMRIPVNLFDVNEWSFVNLGWNVYDQYVLDSTNLDSSTTRNYKVASYGGADFHTSFHSTHNLSREQLTGRMVGAVNTLALKSGVNYEYPALPALTDDFSFGFDFILPPVSSAALLASNLTGYVDVKLGCLSPSTGAGPTNPAANTGIDINLQIGQDNSYLRVGLGAGNVYYNSIAIPSLKNPVINKVNRCVVTKAATGVLAWINGVLVLDTANSLVNPIVASDGTGAASPLTAVQYLKLGRHRYISDGGGDIISKSSVIIQNAYVFSPAAEDADLLAFTANISSSSGGGRATSLLSGRMVS